MAKFFHMEELHESIPTKLGYFEATRTDDGLELIRLNPFAFALVYIIARRANWREEFNAHNLQFGEAFLGDYEKYGMSERKYRTAKAQLAKRGFATFKATSKGTIAKLTNTRVFKINPAKGGGHATNSRRTVDGQPTTNLKLKAGEQENYIALPTKAPKLSVSQKEQADRIETALGVQWCNDAGKWIGRIKKDLQKSERVISELLNAIKEGRIKTTPAQYAEQIWKEFKHRDGKG